MCVCVIVHFSPNDRLSSTHSPLCCFVGDRVLESALDEGSAYLVACIVPWAHPPMCWRELWWYQKVFCFESPVQSGRAKPVHCMRHYEHLLRPGVRPQCLAYLSVLCPWYSMYHVRLEFDLKENIYLYNS